MYSWQYLNIPVAAMCLVRDRCFATTVVVRTSKQRGNQSNEMGERLSKPSLYMSREENSWKLKKHVS